MSVRYCPVCGTNYYSAMGPHSCAGWHPAGFLPAVPTPCPDCAEKDARIAELERAVAVAAEAETPVHSNGLALAIGEKRDGN